MIIDDATEKNILLKALFAAKFPTNEDRLHEISGSSTIVHIITVLMEELQVEREFHIEDYPENLAYIYEILQSRNKRVLDENIKIKYLNDLLFPYKCGKEKLDELLKMME